MHVNAVSRTVVSWGYRKYTYKKNDATRAWIEEARLGG